MWWPGSRPLAALKDIGFDPASDLTAMGIRGEESGDWFANDHIGSRAALGILPPDELDEARQVDTGLTLAEHMARLGLDVDALRVGKRYLDPAAITAYFELHIEQGPVLERDDLPVGIVTGIRGNVRSHNARCFGAYAHSGAVPRAYRRDAVLATTEFIAALEREWDRIEAENGDLVLTFGQLVTDTRVHSLAKVPGETRFTIDARSQDPLTLDRMERVIRDQARVIGERRSVSFDVEPLVRVRPSAMDPNLRARLTEGVAALGIPAMDIPSGAGHDAADFANAGVPSAMIFVRNPHGSHNPDEDMTIADFALGTRLLAWALADSAKAS